MRASRSPSCSARRELREAIQTSAHGLSLDILVVPRASRDEVLGLHGDRIRIAVKAPPVDGAANAALVALLSRVLGVGKPEVTVTRGHSSRRKQVLVKGLALDEVLNRLAP